MGQTLGCSRGGCSPATAQEEAGLQEAGQAVNAKARTKCSAASPAPRLGRPHACLGQGWRAPRRALTARSLVSENSSPKVKSRSCTPSCATDWTCSSGRAEPRDTAKGHAGRQHPGGGRSEAAEALPNVRCMLPPQAPGAWSPGRASRRDAAATNRPLREFLGAGWARAPFPTGPGRNHVPAGALCAPGPPAQSP